VFITPLIDVAFEVAEITTHEIVHASLPDGVKHGKPFREAMKKLGLEGKPTATHAGQELSQCLHAICGTLGEYPHARLSLADAAEKKQGTRMLKLTCVCGYTVRTTAKWIEVGLPTCPCGEEMVLEEK
jgi:hypothetical protein